MFRHACLPAGTVYDFRCTNIRPTIAAMNKENSPPMNQLVTSYRNPAFPAFVGEEKLRTTHELKRCRRVRINHEASIHELPACDTCSTVPKTERKQLWYTKEDFRKFREENMRLAADYRSARRCKKDCSDLPVRGLEPQLTLKANAEARNRVQRMTNVVLQEQARQLLDGDFDEERLREVSRSVTRGAQHIAQRLANEDAIEAGVAAVDDDDDDYEDSEPRRTIQPSSNALSKRPSLLTQPVILKIDRHEARIIVSDYIFQQRIKLM